MTLNDLKDALAEQVAKAGFRVYTERADRADREKGPFAVIELEHDTKECGEVRHRDVTARVRCVTAKRGSRAEWYEAVERLERAIVPVLRVGGRALTVRSTAAEHKGDEGIYTIGFSFFIKPEPQQSGADTMGRIVIAKR